MQVRVFTVLLQKFIIFDKHVVVVVLYYLSNVAEGKVSEKWIDFDVH